MIIKPKRLRIIEAIQNQLKTITTRNGYSNDVGDNVYIGRALFGPNDSLPCIAILESPHPDIGDYAKDREVRRDEWVLLIQGFVDNDPIQSTVPAYHLCADIERCLSGIVGIDEQGFAIDPSIHLLGGLINSVEIAPPVIRPPDDNVSTAYVYLPVRMNVTINLANPYA